MLPEFFKLHIVNNTGAQIDFSTDGANNTFIITGIGWKFDSNGALEYGASEETIFADPSADLGDGASAEGAEYDNSTNKFVGMFCRASYLGDNASAGEINIVIEYSTDGSAAGVYPSDESDFNADLDLDHVASVRAPGGASDDVGVNFELG